MRRARLFGALGLAVVAMVVFAHPGAAARWSCETRPDHPRCRPTTTSGATTSSQPPTSGTTASTVPPTSGTTATSAPPTTVPTGVWRPFSVDGPFNRPIPANPRLDSRNAAIVNRLTGGAHVADLYDFGVPIWFTTGSDPLYFVDCTRPWGTCGLEREGPIPIPLNAEPSLLDEQGGDGAMVVVNLPAGRAYEFYASETRPSGSTWRTGWGGAVPLSGPGTPGEAVGTNMSRLAGVVRAEEIARGYIDHALVFSTDSNCAAGFRYPAHKTDGQSTASDCIQAGSRVQLDPTLDVDTLAVPRATKIVARALQTYGAYVVDTGGARMAIIFEVPSGEPDPYPAAGYSGDYATIGLPWSRLRVLAAWDGS